MSAINKNIIAKEPGLQKIYEAILSACAQITEHIRYNTPNKINLANEFGDVQLDMDVQIDSIIFDALSESEEVFAAASEEKPQLIKLNENGKYIVTFDPLDGSSIIDSNLAIGTIVAIWKKPEDRPDGDLIGLTARTHMVGAALSCYGSRTNILVYNTENSSVDELTLQRSENDDDNEWVVSNKNIMIKPEGHFFAPGNAKSMKYNKGYREII